MCFLNVNEIYIFNRRKFSIEIDLNRTPMANQQNQKKIIFWGGFKKKKGGSKKTKLKYESGVMRN